MEDFCESCGVRVRNCPIGAIKEEKEPYGEKIEGIGRLRRCVDQLKCFSIFAPSSGCSMCLKVCPFSQGNRVYETIRLEQVKVIDENELGREH